MNIGAVITGDDRVIAALGRLPDVARTAVRAGLATAGDEAVGVLQAKTSGRPGPNIVSDTLHGTSWTQSPYEVDTRLGVVVASNDVPGKLRALEWGHPRWAPGTMYPFFKPARDELRGRYRGIMAAALGLSR